MGRFDRLREELARLNAGDLSPEERTSAQAWLDDLVRGTPGGSGIYSGYDWIPGQQPAAPEAPPAKRPVRLKATVKGRLRRSQ